MTELPDIHADQTAAWIFFAVAVVFFVASIVGAARESSRTRTLIPVFALLGGLVAALEESWIDTIIQLRYPDDSPLVAFTTFGNAQPLYLHLIYPGFIGLGAYVAYRQLLRDPTGRSLWSIFGGIVALDVMFEVPATATGVFQYYGAHQPFQFFDGGWPAWVACINAAGPIVGGFLIYRLAPKLQGRSTALLVLAPPFAYAGTYGLTAWPTVTLLNSDAPAVVVWFGGALSAALAAVVVGMVRTLLPAVPESAPTTNTTAAAGQPDAHRSTPELVGR